MLLTPRLFPAFLALLALPAGPFCQKIQPDPDQEDDSGIRVRGQSVEWDLLLRSDAEPGSLHALRSRGETPTWRKAERDARNKALVRVDSLSSHAVHATVVKPLGSLKVPGGLELAPVPFMMVRSWEYSYQAASRGRLHNLVFTFNHPPVGTFRHGARIPLGWYLDERGYPFALVGAGSTVGLGHALGAEWSLEAEMQLDIQLAMGFDDQGQGVADLFLNLGPMVSIRRPISRFSEIILGVGYRLSRNGGVWFSMRGSDDEEDPPDPRWDHGAPRMDFTGLAFRIGWSWYRFF